MATLFSKDLEHRIIDKLSAVYEVNESVTLAFLLLENIFGLTKTDLLLNANINSEEDKDEILDVSITRLLKFEPIQHILGHAEFYGRKFKVNKNVLIPRQETEELINLIVNENTASTPKILDIGTGSGCIACSLADEIKKSKVSALDISDNALELANENSKLLGLEVSFYRVDILKEQIPSGQYDIIVSNPPYVLQSEKELMHKNVVDFDPHLALFVSDEDPLLFYNNILDKGRSALKPFGKLYFEINGKFGQEVANSFSEYGYSKVEIHQDLNGKDRFVSGIWGS